VDSLRPPKQAIPAIVWTKEEETSESYVAIMLLVSPRCLKKGATFSTGSFSGFFVLPSYRLDLQKNGVELSSECLEYKVRCPFSKDVGLWLSYGLKGKASTALLDG
jgi:hypothetical protein